MLSLSFKQIAGLFYQYEYNLMVMAEKDAQLLLVQKIAQALLSSVECARCKRKAKAEGHLCKKCVGEMRKAEIENLIYSEKNHETEQDKKASQVGNSC
jgi:predicted amidophosphoribosyltransferase